jgi:hypothetical protein
MAHTQPIELTAEQRDYLELYSASENPKIRKREFQKMQTTFPKSAK